MLWIKNLKLFFLIIVLTLVTFPCIKYTYASAPYEASDVLGQPDYTSQNANYGLGSTNSQGFEWPTSAVIDYTHHRLFVGEGDGSNNRVLIFNLDTSNNLIDHTADFVLGQPDFETASSGTTQNQFNFTYGDMTYDQIYDRLFVTDYSGNRVMVFDLSQGISNGMNAAYVLGQPNFESNTDYGPTQSSISSPFGGIAYDTNTGYLFVNDYGNKRITVFDVNPDTIANGMNALYVIGQSNFTANETGIVSASRFGYSYGIEIDNVHHRLFVSDTGNDRVLVFDLTNLSNGMDASYVLGQSDFTSNIGNTASLNGIHQPNGIVYDSEKNILFIADYGNSRYLEFQMDTISNNMNAIGVLGQPDFESTNFGTSQTEFDFDYTLTTGFDPVSHRIYIPDGYNHRILIFSFINLPTSLITPTVGNSYSQSLAATQSQGTVTYELVSGTLPLGLSFNTTSALLSGTPTTPGTYTFTIKATDDNGAIGYFFDTQEYTLTVAGVGSTSSSPRPEGEFSTTEAPVCRYTSPLSAPNLFSIKRNGTDAVLHFTPIPSNTSYYFISYGVTKDAEGYSLEIPQPIDTTGAISQDIHMLQPNTTYYFKVRAGNNCMPGPWSGVMREYK